MRGWLVAVTVALCSTQAAAQRGDDAASMLLDEVSADAEGARRADEKAYAVTYFVRRHALLFASAHLCDLKLQRQSALADIQRERDGAKYSGMVDKQVLYEAGQELRELDEQIRDVSAAIKKVLKRAPMSCSHAVVAEMVNQYDCGALSDDCNPHFTSARNTTVEVFLEGSDLRNAETVLRDRVSDAWAAYTSEWESRFASAVAEASKGRKAK